ncbi:MAG: acyl carrier protein [Byssovorax sp.]
MDERKTTIRAYLTRFFPGCELRDGDDLFAVGFVTSMFAIQLVTFVESAFAIEIENEDLELDNFRSVEAIARLVERKVGGRRR